MVNLRLTQHSSSWQARFSLQRRLILRVLLSRPWCPAVLSITGADVAEIVSIIRDQHLNQQTLRLSYSPAGLVQSVESRQGKDRGPGELTQSAKHSSRVIVTFLLDKRQLSD